MLLECSFAPFLMLISSCFGGYQEKSLLQLSFSNLYELKNLEQ